MHKYGLLHNENGYALKDNLGFHYYKYGLLHREDGPAKVVKSYYYSNFLHDESYMYGFRHDQDHIMSKSKYGHYIFGTYHCENGRTLEDNDEHQIQIFSKYGLKHNSDGPAVINETNQYYYQYGLLHRKYDPAYISKNFTCNYKYGKKIMLEKFSWKNGL